MTRKKQGKFKRFVGVRMEEWMYNGLAGWADERKMNISDIVRGVLEAILTTRDSGGKIPSLNRKEYIQPIESTIKFEIKDQNLPTLAKI